LFDVSNEFKARHVIQINNIQSNRQCCILQDCERFGQPIFCDAVNCPGRGYHASKRRGVELCSCFGGGLPGNRGIAAGFAMADDANRITARQTTETGEAAIPRGSDIERSDLRLAALKCDAEGKASKLSSSWSKLFGRAHGRKAPHARREKNRIYGNNYSDRRGNSIARRRDELGDRSRANVALIVLLGRYRKQAPKKDMSVTLSDAQGKETSIRQMGSVEMAFLITGGAFFGADLGGFSRFWFLCPPAPSRSPCFWRGKRLPGIHG
jgi:hypothetical protein